MSIRFETVSHRFGRQPALRDVTIHVERGDCYGFIGHNGAGKTTAMRIMLGLLAPQSGRVIVDGFDAAAYPREARARMGGLIEVPGFHGHWSGARNLRLLDRLAGGRSDVDGLLKLVGLADAGAKPVGAYSQGMRQRLGVAQALLGNPRYVLLDEPTNGLDPDGIKEIRAIVRRLTRDEGKTVFLSSHQLHELAGLCNRVGVLRAGRLVLEESLDTLLAGDLYELSTDADETARELLTDFGLQVATESGLVVGPLRDKKPGDLVRRLVGAGLEVRSFAPREPTLEDVYHREVAEPVPAREPAASGRPTERLAPGHSILRMLGHETRRWLGQITVPLMLVLPTAVGVVAMLLRRKAASGYEQEVGAGSLFSTTAVNAFEGVAMALHPGLWVMCYVVLGLASQSVAGELSQGTLRNVLIRPLNRWQVSIGKMLSLMFAALVSWALLVGVSLAVAGMAFDYTGVFEILDNGKRIEQFPASEISAELMDTLLSPLLPLAAFAGIGFLAGTLMRRGAAALALALGLGFLLDMARDMFPAWEAWFPSAYVPSLASTSFVNYFLDVSQGFNNATYYLSESDISVPLLWTTVTFGLAALVFRRRYVP